MKFVSGVLWSKDKSSPVSPSIPLTPKGKGRAKEGSTFGSSRRGGSSPLERNNTDRFKEFGALPKAWKVFEDAGWNTATQVGQPIDILRGCRKVVVIGVHGWFPGTMIRTVLGEVNGHIFIASLNRAFMNVIANRDQHQVCVHDAASTGGL